MLVAPPLLHGGMWWASHQDTGRPQPGCAQPPSRTANPCRIAAVNSRSLRPTSSGAPAPSTVTTPSQVLSQVIRSAVAALIGPGETQGCPTNPVFCGPDEGDVRQHPPPDVGRRELRQVGPHDLAEGVARRLPTGRGSGEPSGSGMGRHNGSSAVSSSSPVSASRSRVAATRPSSVTTTVISLRSAFSATGTAPASGGVRRRLCRWRSRGPSWPPATAWSGSSTW